MRRQFKRTAGVNCENKQIITIETSDGYERIEIRKRKPRSLWSNIIWFISNLEIGDTFTRQQLLERTYSKSVYEYITPSIYTSADTYLSYLKKLEIVTTVSRGKYKKILNIPIDTTVTTIRKILDERKTWKGWFQPLHDKLGMTKEELEK